MNYNFFNAPAFFQGKTLSGLLLILTLITACTPKENKHKIIISALSSSSGSTAGGTDITITGSGFTFLNGVTFGGRTCANLVIHSPNSLTCTIPSHPAGTVAVTVFGLANRSSSASYTYVAIAPTITSFSPLGGALAGGTTLTITGTDLAAGAQVEINGQSCTSVNVLSSTSLTCISPANVAGSYNVEVISADGLSGIAASQYTYRPAPTLSSVSPNFGSTAGGTSITITGSGFVTGATVTVQGGTCLTPVVVDANTLTCTTPARYAGSSDIVITNIDGQNVTASGIFTYYQPPAVKAISPTGGALAGGTTLSILGSGFVSGSTVTVGGLTCTSPTVSSSNNLTCVTPANVSGTYDVVVTNPSTLTGALSAAYTYRPAPTVSALSPDAGPLAGGGTVTITGTGFLSGAQVTLGGSACSLESITSSTSMTCVLPAKTAGAVTVVVTNTDNQSGSLASGYTYQAPPTITGITPNGGPLAGGTTITIDGSGFVSGITATVGGNACTTPTYVSSTQMTCLTPAGPAGAVDVVVTNPDLQTGTSSAGFTYQNAPTVTSVSPDAGALAGGTTITLTGTGFLAGATVDLGGSDCGSVTISSSTSLTCVTSAHTGGSVNITVTNPDTQTGSLAAGYTYQAAPTVSSVSPNAGPLAGGTAITITGTDFNSGATVTIGGSSCTGVTVVSSTSITCTTPALAAGSYTVTVTNADTQSGSLSSGFTYQEAPTFSSISPNSGVQAGGTLVTITGTNFLSGVSVEIDALSCTGVTLISSTSLTCSTPPNVAGTVNVDVINTDGQFATGAGAYTYTAIPVLAFQVGSASPTPPDPDDYGSTTTNITHTFTVKNTGEATSTAITTSLGGTDPSAWSIGTDNCNGITLTAGSSCTIQVTFLGGFVASGSYSATIEATASSGGTTTNSLIGSRP